MKSFVRLPVAIGRLRRGNFMDKTIILNYGCRGFRTAAAGDLNTAAPGNFNN